MDRSLAVESLVGVEEQGEVGPGRKEVAIASRLASSFEQLATFGEQVGLGLPERGRGVVRGLGHRRVSGEVSIAARAGRRSARLHGIDTGFTTRRLAGW